MVTIAEIRSGRSIAASRLIHPPILEPTKIYKNESLTSESEIGI
jgi:hypothetical protein